MQGPGNCVECRLPGSPPHGDMEGQLDPKPGTQGWRQGCGCSGDIEVGRAPERTPLESSVGGAGGGDGGGAGETGGKPASAGERGSDSAEEGHQEDRLGHP